MLLLLLQQQRSLWLSFDSPAGLGGPGGPTVGEWSAAARHISGIGFFFMKETPILILIVAVTYFNIVFSSLRARQGLRYKPCWAAAAAAAAAAATELLLLLLWGPRLHRSPDSLPRSLLRADPRYPRKGRRK